MPVILPVQTIMKVPALLMFRNGMKIHILKESQLRLMPDDVTFEYAGCQDGLNFYTEKAA